jgi:hypothetical protein
MAKSLESQLQSAKDSLAKGDLPATIDLLKSISTQINTQYVTCPQCGAESLSLNQLAECACGAMWGTNDLKKARWERFQPHPAGELEWEDFQDDSMAQRDSTHHGDAQVYHISKDSHRRWHLGVQYQEDDASLGHSRSRKAAKHAAQEHHIIEHYGFEPHEVEAIKRAFPEGVHRFTHTHPDQTRADVDRALAAMEKSISTTPLLKSDYTEGNMRKPDLIKRLWEMYRSGDPDVSAFDINNYEASSFIKKSLLIKLGIEVPQEELKKSEPEQLWGGLTKSQILNTMLGMFKSGEEAQYVHRHSIAKFEHAGEISDETLNLILKKNNIDPFNLSKKTIEDQDKDVKNKEEVIHANPANGSDAEEMASDVKKN